MEVTLKRASEPESTGKSHKNDLKLELYGLEDENTTLCVVGNLRGEI